MRAINLTGQRFGMLLVKELTDDYISPKGVHYRRWLCKCDCGNKTKVTTADLRSGHTKSCGCYGKQIGKTNKKYNTYDLSGEYGIGYTFDNKPFYFDKEDYEKIKDYCWRYDKDVYVISNISGSSKNIILHRLVMDVFDQDSMWCQIDHINHKRYDDRKCNLRTVTPSQNRMNIGIRANNTSGATGIGYSKRDNLWYAEATVHGEKHRKQFHTKEDAIKHRERIVELYHGEYSYENSINKLGDNINGKIREKKSC